MKIPLLDLSRQQQTLQPALSEAVEKVMKAAHYIMGPEVLAFEKEMQAYLGAKYAISCANGTDALVLSLRALGIGFGDEVITTPFTFFATAEAISTLGAIPVFVDVKENTYNIDPQKIEEKITQKTKAVVVVHIFGQPAEMHEIMTVAKKYNLKVVEDACQAIGSKYRGQKVGAIGDVGCFSFFPTKNLGAFGDGGMVVTNNHDIAKIIKGLKVHGSGALGLQAYNVINKSDSDIEQRVSFSEVSAKYFNFIVGVNSRLDEIQAAVLRVKLPYLDEWNSKRRKAAAIYSEKLKHTHLRLAQSINDVDEIFHLYVIRSSKRSNLLEFLAEKGISTGIYYPVPLHLQKVYDNLGYRDGDLPVAEMLSKETFALPLFPELTEEEQNYILDCIYEFENR